MTFSLIADAKVIALKVDPGSNDEKTGKTRLYISLE